MDFGYINIVETHVVTFSGRNLYYIYTDYELYSQFKPQQSYKRLLLEHINARLCITTYG